MLTGLRGRLVMGVAVLALAAVAAVALAARQGTRTAFVHFRETEQEHAHRLAETHRGLRAALDGRCCGPAALSAAAESLNPDTGFVVIAEGDRVLAWGGASLDGVSGVRVSRTDAPLALIIERAGQDTVRVTIPPHGTPIVLDGGGKASVHAVRMPTVDELRRIQAFYGSLDDRLIVATSIVGLLAVALAWLFAQRLVRPLEDVAAASQDLARGELARRVPASGSSEIAKLARSFNAMAEELERQEALRRNLVKDVAHELRTPLTSLRCRLEAAIDGMTANPADAMREAREEVLHLGRLVDDLQELSLAEANELHLVVEAADVMTVVRSAARAAGLEGDTRFRMGAGHGLRARTDAMRLRQILVNLLTNAARYTPGGGTITAEAHASGAEVVVSVHNTGSTLADDDLSRVFDRFYRADPARQRSTGGAGLGLAIVKTLVTALGGRVWAESGPGHVRFSVALPAEPEPS